MSSLYLSLAIIIIILIGFLILTCKTIEKGVSQLYLRHETIHGKFSLILFCKEEIYIVEKRLCWLLKWLQTVLTASHDLREGSVWRKHSVPGRLGYQANSSGGGGRSCGRGRCPAR